MKLYSIIENKGVGSNSNPQTCIKAYNYEVLKKWFDVIPEECKNEAIDSKYDILLVQL